MLLFPLMVPFLAFCLAVQTDLRPAFLPYATFFRTDRERQAGRDLELGISDSQLERLVDNTCVDVYRSEPSSVPTVESLALSLRKTADRAILQEGIQQPSRLLRQWVSAEMICAWVVSHVDGDPELAEEKDFNRWWNGIPPAVTLAKRPIRTICSGNALLSRDIARAMGSELGLGARYIGGWLRSDDGSVPEASNHAWTMFTFEGGLQVPADTVSPATSRANRAAWRFKRGAWPILPRSREAWEVFLAFHYGVETFHGGDWEPFPKIIQDPNTRLTLAQWRSMKDVTTALAVRRSRKRID